MAFPAFPKGLQYCGCIAIDALEQVGSGVEGWLENPSVVFAMSRDQMVFARERTIVMQLRWKGSGDGSEALMTRVGVSSEFQENVTSLEWLAFDDFTVLAVGTSLGAILFYSQSGILLFRQVAPNSRVLLPLLRYVLFCVAINLESSYLCMSVLWDFKDT